MPGACAQRRHRWARNPPTPGTRCTKCEAVFHQKKGAAAGAPTDGTSTDPQNPIVAPPATNAPASRYHTIGTAGPISEARAGALRAALARFAPPPPHAEDDLEIEPAAPAPRGWTRMAGPKIATVFVAASEAAIEKLGRRANEPADADLDEFGEALSAQLARWFPDSELSPGKQCLILGAAIVSEMWIGAEKLTPEERARKRLAPLPVRPVPVAAAAPAADTPRPPPPPPQPTNASATPAPVVPTAAIEAAFMVADFAQRGD